MRSLIQRVRTILDPDIDMGSTTILKEWIVGQYSFALGYYDLCRPKPPPPPDDDGTVRAAFDVLLDELVATGKFKLPTGRDAYEPYAALATALGKEPIGYLHIAREKHSSSVMTLDA